MLTIDEKAGTLTVTEEGRTRTLALGSTEAFRLLSQVWVRAGWEAKYSYGFTWMGRPIIQIPEDMVRVQEALWRIKPDVVIETGIAHGGSLIYYAGLMKAMGKGRVIGVDIEIRPHNRTAIEAHPMFPMITLIEGNSIAADTVQKVRDLVKPGETVFIMLDGKHTKDHVLAELEAYGPLVTKGSYIVAADGVMSMVASAPRGQPDWSWDNPTEAAREFASKHPEFEIEKPQFDFNESEIDFHLTYWPQGYLKRIA